MWKKWHLLSWCLFRLCSAKSSDMCWGVIAHGVGRGYWDVLFMQWGTRGEEYLVVELSPSRVDGNDLTSASTHEQDPVETFSQDLEELHVCVSEVKRQTLTFTWNVIHKQDLTSQVRQTDDFILEEKRIQFSSPVRFLGGPGMFSRTSFASWDFFTMTSLSFCAWCMRLTFDWFLYKTSYEEHCKDFLWMWGFFIWLHF